MNAAEQAEIIRRLQASGVYFSQPQTDRSGNVRGRATVPWSRVLHTLVSAHNLRPHLDRPEAEGMRLALHAEAGGRHD